jgi:aryl-alcohol dehydrogenase-like predicted oxidoreductase
MLSTKLLMDTQEIKPNTAGLNLKHLIEGIKQSLKNLG